MINAAYVNFFLVFICTRRRGRRSSLIASPSSPNCVNHLIFVFTYFIASDVSRSRDRPITYDYCIIHVRKPTSRREQKRNLASPHHQFSGLEIAFALFQSFRRPGLSALHGNLVNHSLSDKVGQLPFFFCRSLLVFRLTELSLADE